VRTNLSSNIRCHREFRGKLGNTSRFYREAQNGRRQSADRLAQAGSPISERDGRSQSGGVGIVTVGSTDKVLDIELSYHNSSLCAFLRP
jgi:hypothetical protein